jgi:hypothetical protein
LLLPLLKEFFIYQTTVKGQIFSFTFFHEFENYPGPILLINLLAQGRQGANIPLSGLDFTGY